MAPLTVARDPRVAATDADLRAQFNFALVVADEQQVVSALQARIRKMLAASKSPATKLKLQQILGHGPLKPDTPDEGGTVSKDFGSLRRIGDALGAIHGMIESAPAAPTSGAIQAFRDLKQRVARITNQLAEIR